MERKLAAILAADVVGYAALMERDEQDTHERLRAGRKELFEPEIALHHGRVFKVMGDGMLAEFGSVVDAVECAVSLQRGLAERNANVPVDRQIQVRIGINIGEVIVEGDDRFGEGVNIAARLEQLAEPGGICVSGKVAKEVEKKLAFGFEPMGDQHVKNIAEPIQAFRVKLDGASAARTRQAVKGVSLPTAIAAGVLCFLAIVAGGWYFMQKPGPEKHEPSIAVLPFKNMSGDPAQDYVGPGIAEDIITMLSSYPTMRVVSRTSSFALDGNIRVQQIGKELGVDYVIEGSVRKSGDRVRVTAQLIKAATEEHVWADRYDEEGTDVTAMQDAVAYRIYSTVAGLRGEIQKREQAVAWGKPGPSLEEYDYYLRGHQLFFQFTQEGNAKAREIWQEGLVKFPDSALLRTKIAFTYMQDIVRERTDDPWSYAELGWKLAKEAEAIPNKSGLEELLTHWALAYFYWLHEGDFERSAEEAELTAALVPNDSFTRADVAQFLINAGRPQQAIEWLEDAILHDPNPMEWYFGNLAFAYYVAGRPADAIVQLKKMKNPWQTLVAATYVRVGQLDEAQAVMAEFSRDNPNYRLQDEAVWPTYKQPQFAEAVLKPYLDDLAKAGLREK